MISDRSRFAGAWLACVAGLGLQGELVGVGATVVGVVLGGVMAWVGTAAASRCRALPRRSGVKRGRLVVLSAAAGVGLDNAWTSVEGTEEPPPRTQGEIVTDEDGSGAKALAEFLASKKFI